MQQMIHNNIICRRTARRRRNRLTVSTQFPRDPQSTCFHCISTWTFTVAPQTGRSADTKLGTVQMQHWQQNLLHAILSRPSDRIRSTLYNACLCRLHHSQVNVLSMLWQLEYDDAHLSRLLKISYSLPLHYPTQRQQIN
jgi:hypothetical protein